MPGSLRTLVACRVVAAQLNSRVTDLVATQAALKAGRGDAQVMRETQSHHAGVSKLQRNLVGPAVDLAGDGPWGVAGQWKSTNAQCNSGMSMRQIDRSFRRNTRQNMFHLTFVAVINSCCGKQLPCVLLLPFVHLDVFTSVIA